MKNPVKRQRFIAGAVMVILLLAAYKLLFCNTKKTTPIVLSHRKVFLKTTDRYWVQAKEVEYKTVPELMAQHKSELERGVNHYILRNGSKQQKAIALTFDDGPHPLYTKKILAILRKYNVKATFFLVGDMAEKYPDLVRDEMADGHSIGNHTYHHVNLTRIPAGFIATELGACDEVLQSITHKPVKLFRPPGGDYNDSVAEVCEVMKQYMVLWTDDPGDYARPGADVIKNRVLEKAKNGGIILIHDGVQQTIDALPSILQTLKDRGFKIVTVDEMLKEKSIKS